MNTNVLRAVTSKLREPQSQGSRRRPLHRQQGLGFPEPYRALLSWHSPPVRDTPHLKSSPALPVLLDAYAEGKINRGVPLLHQVHRQHHEAGIGGGAVAAPCPRSR